MIRLLLSALSLAALALPCSAQDIVRRTEITGVGSHIHAFDPDAAFVLVELVGGGGAGGGAESNDTTRVSAGDGGGSGSWVRFAVETIPLSATIVIGAGAAGGTGHGLDGGATSYQDSDELVRATGGSGGTIQLTSSIVAVSNGESGDAEGATGGGLVGHPSLMAQSNRLAMGGAGAGLPPFGQAFPGARVVGSTEKANGKNAVGYGAGGSGAASNGAGAASGGNGAPGIAVITEWMRP